MFSRALKLILRAFIWSVGLVNVHHTGTILWVGGTLTMLGLRGPSWRRSLVASGVGAAAIAVLTNDRAGCVLGPQLPDSLPCGYRRRSRRARVTVAMQSSP